VDFRHPAYCASDREPFDRDADGGTRRHDTQRRADYARAARDDALGVTLRTI
jgi:hypothetical protein